MSIRSMLVLPALLLTLPALAEQPNIQPGEWEYTNVMRYEGVPMPEQRTTNRECVTQEDVEQGAAFVEESEECDVTDMNLTRDQATYKMVCIQEGVRMDMDLAMRFMGTSAEGTMRAKMETPMGPMQMNMQISGRRLGDC